MHNSISGTEAADRLAIRELIEAYAHCADRRDAKGQMSLFTEDTHFVVLWMPNPLSQPWTCIAVKIWRRYSRTSTNMKRPPISWGRARLFWTKITRLEKRTVSLIMFLHRKENDQCS
jgi:SnoaL-like domain